MPTQLADLTALLDKHFTFAPPLDKYGAVPNSLKPEEVREYGIGINFGDGTSKEGLRGLENMQLFEPGKKPTSLQAWMESAIDQKTDPLAIAADLQELLLAGRVTYFEQGREFANQLFVNSHNRIETYPLTPDILPPGKPTLTFGQGFLNLFGLLGFFQPDTKAQYDRQMADYDQHYHALKLAEVRGRSAHISEQPAAENGRLIAGDPKALEALEHASTNRQERSRLPEEQQLSSAYEKMLETETDPARKQMLEEKLAPSKGAKKEVKEVKEVIEAKEVKEVKEVKEAKEDKNGSKEFEELLDAEVKSPAAQAREQEILKFLYPVARPEGINSLADHRNSKVELQNSSRNIVRMKQGSSMALNPRTPPMLVTPVLMGIQAMLSNDFKIDVGMDTNLIGTAKAYTDLFQDRQKTEMLIHTDKFLDQFATNLEQNPIPGLNQQAIKNLVEVCIEPHPALRAVAADPHFKSFETSLQSVKEMGNLVVKPPEIAKKPEPKQMGPK